MNETLYITETVIRDIFISYGWYSFLYLVVRLARVRNVSKVDEYANQFLTAVGLLYLLGFLVHIIHFVNTNTDEVVADFYGRAFGKYWFGFWTQPILWILLTQLVRFRIFRSNLALRFLICFFLMFSIESLVIIMTSLHRDYLPSSWSMSPDLNLPENIILNVLLKIVLFLALVGIYFLIKSGVRKIYKNQNPN